MRRPLLTIEARGRRTIAKVVVLAALVVAAAVLAQPAAAVPPTTIDFTGAGGGPLEAGTLCSFPIDVTWTQEGTITYFYDRDGVLTKRIVAGSEQDTFSANGKTLVGDRYHLTFIADYENGVRVAYHEDGIAERVQLPGGGVFIVAGRVDVLAAGGGFIVSVDAGNSGNNLDAFCAALS